MKKLCKNKKQQNNQGLTLVEMLVSFALLGIFMVAASMMIASIMNVYYEAKGTSYGMQVSNVIMDKIAGELESAIGGDIVSEEFKDAAGQGIRGAMLIGSEKVEFINSSGSHVSLGLIEQDGLNYLAFHYYEVPSADGSDVLYDAVDWTFDAGTYMGYSIKELEFSRPMGAYAYNVIKIDITITSPRYGDYSVTEYVQCYKFDGAVNASSVVDIDE
jgi:prepilin-type N-terminal cleavage/methylation domain-containing protein